MAHNRAGTGILIAINSNLWRNQYYALTKGSIMVTVDNKTSSVLNNNFSKATSNIKSTLMELASGKRINKASDDPASAAIINQLSGEIKTSVVATRNISDGISAIQIADSATSSISDLVGRAKELATQSANGTLSDDQRSILDQEYQDVLSEINRIEGSTSFNGVQLLGSSTSIQTGTSNNENSKTQINISSLNTTSLGLNGSSIANQNSAKAALDSANSSQEVISSARAELGAAESNLTTAYENLKTSVVNNQSAKSYLEDADYADATARNLAAKISQQGSTSLMAINNQSQANVIKALLS